MEHNFVFNKLSTPAVNSEDGYRLLLDSVKGMLAVGANDDRFAMYSDDLQNYPIAPDYFYRDFISQLGERHETDLQIALLEIDDKTPMLDFLSEDLFNEIASSAYYFPGEAYDGSVDVLAIAWHLDATLLSIATADKWRRNEIEFVEFVEGKPSTGSSYLRNVSSEMHGNIIRERYLVEAQTPIQELFPRCLFSMDFLQWIDLLPKDVFKRVVDKVALANTKEFFGGEPLFKTLHDADGIREIRFSAVQGGTIRILFQLISENRSAILYGFIKKSDNEGYTVAINAAKKNLKQMVR